MEVDEELLECALELDKAYILARYPNAHPSSSPRRRYTKREAERLIEYAEKYTSSVKVFYPKFNKEQIIEEVSRSAGELREKLGLEAVILFGSYAKGSRTAASDIDLLIIFNNEKAGQNEVYATLMRNIKLPNKELHLIPKKELENYEKTKWLKTIRKEGIKIL